MSRAQNLHESIRPLVGAGVVEAHPVSGGDICRTSRLRLDDGREVVCKSLTGAPKGFFQAEARGLAWLGEAGAEVPAVLGATASVLVLDWVTPGPPTRAAADSLGRMLAQVHRAGAQAFGGPTPAFIGSLPMDNRPLGQDQGSWAEFYAARRVQPALRLARERGGLDPDQAADIERLLDRIDRVGGPAEPPARLHGDLWSGNVLWRDHGAPALIDPAAHGGHRETDLAMLALFGLPQLDRVLASYDEIFPLAEGWRDRVGLHQLWPLLVHAATHGPGYGSRAARLAQALS